jgi:hypothetical protein
VCLSLNTWSLTPDPGSDFSSPLVLLSDLAFQNFRKKVKREVVGLFDVVRGTEGPLRYFGSLVALLETHAAHSPAHVIPAKAGIQDGGAVPPTLIGSIPACWIPARAKPGSS